MKLSALMIVFAQCAWCTCLPVHGDRILGADFALADPAFASLPASATFGFAPAPGTPRTFAAAEITRLARANHVDIAAPAPEVCFEIPMRQLTAEDAIQAMRSGIPEAANLEILDLPTAPAPAGTIHFPPASLEPGTDSRLWRGYVQYTPTRRSPIWAKVRIRVTMEALVLTTSIARGTPITAASIETRTVNVTTLQPLIAVRPDQVLGTTTRADLKSGETIPLTALERPPAVRRGDNVQVDVLSGAARIRLEAVAQSDARNGDFIDLLNPVTGKRFRARLNGSVATLALGGHL